MPKSAITLICCPFPTLLVMGAATTILLYNVMSTRPPPSTKGFCLNKLNRIPLVADGKAVANYKF